MAVLVWAAIYPLITVIFVLFGKTFEQIELLPLRTLVITGVVVPLMVFLVLPILQKLFSNWLKT